MKAYVLHAVNDLRYDEIDKYSYSDRIEMIIDVNPVNIVKNMQSFRYVDKNEFTYVIPKNIQKYADANILYENTMKMIDERRKQIRDLLVMHGVDYKKAVEDANFVLPRATNLTLTIGFTPEALIQFMFKRLCARAQDEIRDIAKEMKKEVEKIIKCNSSAMRRFRRILRRYAPVRQPVTRCVSYSVRAPISRQSRKLASLGQRALWRQLAQTSLRKPRYRHRVCLLGPCG